MVPRGSAAATAGLRRRRLGPLLPVLPMGSEEVGDYIISVFVNISSGRSFSLWDAGTLEKSELAIKEKNRASAAAMNAEVRKTKARLMDELPKLKKLANKKVKGLSKEEQAIRPDLVLALPERIQAIADGIEAAAKQSGGLAGSTPNKNVKFDSSDEHLHDDFFQQTEESSQFKQEYEMRKIKQDQGLDFILEGLDTLKDLAHDMNEELDRQVPLIDEIDTKADKATSDLRNTNVRLKKTIVEYIEMKGFHGLVLLSA
ncbi:hypothetical protein GH714_014113 [Hevea brasiliensis]|uniref:t-SNARE coiled-coil homology domain-containing protein n=1 Tax=Hevea brasiliensis TaxID=3981 RepID=A0A6A6LJ54_HEVBR|nr:hypothetical protein GH714_014113 [Hevea brasiliensis]